MLNIYKPQQINLIENSEIHWKLQIEEIGRRGENRKIDQKETHRQTIKNINKETDQLFSFYVVVMELVLFA